MAQLDRILDRFDLATLEAALARRRAKEKRNLAAIEKRRREIEAELRKLGGAAPAKAKSKPRRAAAKRKPKPNARRLNKITLAEALIRVMAPRKEPIHYKELTEAVVKRGLYRTKSKSLLSTVMITLLRDKRFTKVEPGVFALAQ